MPSYGPHVVQRAASSVARCDRAAVCGLVGSVVRQSRVHTSNATRHGVGSRDRRPVRVTREAGAILRICARARVRTMLLCVRTVTALTALTDRTPSPHLFLR